jgi:hypothetical protein
MVVVRHQHITVDLNPKPFRKLPQPLEKVFVATSLTENCSPLMTPVDYVIPPMRNL